LGVTILDLRFGICLIVLHNIKLTISAKTIIFKSFKDQNFNNYLLLKVMKEKMLKRTNS